MKIAFVFVLMLSCTVTANLLLKIGTHSGQPTQGSITHLFNWQILLGLTSFGLAALCYTLILQWLPLNVATSMAAAQYVAVIFASALLLSEPIEFNQWFGIAFITVGISIIGWSQN